MSRQIDADRLYEVIKNSWDTSDAEDFEKSVFVALATAPTIEQRKTGEWIEVEDFYNRIRGRCSECGWEAHMYEDDVVGMDYCPNCGARLEKRGDI